MFIDNLVMKYLSLALGADAVVFEIQDHHVHFFVVLNFCLFSFVNLEVPSLKLNLRWKGMAEIFSAISSRLALIFLGSSVVMSVFLVSST